jgi:hypothetical protein
MPLKAQQERLKRMIDLPNITPNLALEWQINIAPIRRKSRHTPTQAAKTNTKCDRNKRKYPPTTAHERKRTFKTARRHPITRLNIITASIKTNEDIVKLYPQEQWLHIYTDGSLKPFEQKAGIGIEIYFQGSE